MRFGGLVVAVTLVAVASLSCIELMREVEVRQEPLPVDETALRWLDLPAEYCLDLSLDGYVDDPTFQSLVQRAFTAWGVPVEALGRCDGDLEPGDERNQIGWSNPRTEGRGDVYEAGFTRIRFRDCARRCPPNIEAQMIEADILIDRMPPRSHRNSRCLFAVILHEVGHFLGVPHLPRPAVMSAVSSACPQELTNADRQALTERYGQVRE